MKRYLILILSLSALISCKKTESFHVIGNVKHIYTHANISDMYVTIKLNFGVGAVSDDDPYYATTYTDSDGNFVLDFDLKVKKSFNNNFEISVRHPDGYDSTRNTFKYCWTGKELDDYSSDNYVVNFELTPSGSVGFYTTDSIWNSINADSILIQSPYESMYLIRNVTQNDIIYFNVDPSTESTFIWCYIKNGIQNSIVTQDIFVPNWWTFFYDGSNKVFKYEIKF